MNEAFQKLWDEVEPSGESEPLNTKDGQQLLQWLDRVFDEALTRSMFIPFGVRLTIILRRDWPQYNAVIANEAELCKVIDSCIKTLTACRDSHPRELYAKSAALVKGWLERQAAQANQ